ncbi:MAG: 16S rRNA (adenine(1518)-N(6)/adenine(1519)-N(6))-dimethyltransferase RsmA [Lachnospiraceae bacterium]|nr:16S rRNA (adenine(1518)-N(6)/adenine(1519)-N(6))-dimethyltransferase RsmA [Lachnospiraceae bacterium]
MDRILASPGATLEVLDQFGIRARKKYGQNFLIDANIVRGIIDTAEITREDCVLEIGPGIGTMTQLLSGAAGQVVCVEIDESLKPVLAYTLSDCPNVTILWQDVLKTDLQALRDQYAPGRRMKVVANLPYYVTTPILMMLLEQQDLFESITVMVQKEVADRICAGPGSKEYGAISLAVQYYAQPEAAIRVAPSCFIPHPNVDSTVLYLKAYEQPPVDADKELMFALIRAAFNQRRKTLANAVSHGLQAPSGPYTRQQVENALKSMNLPETARGETLGLEQYAALSKYLGYDTLNPV